MNPLASPAEIGVLEVRGARGDRTALRLALSSLLDGMDPRPPGVAPSCILIVRRLADPAPGRLAPRRRAAGPDGAWEKALHRALADIDRRAARPENGRIPPGADAVRFADEAEMLACLALDLSQGAARERWWWRLILRALPAQAAGGLPALLCECARFTPAAVRHLADWGQTAPVLRALSERDVVAVLGAIGAAHAAPGLAEILAPPRTVPGPDLAPDPATAGARGTIAPPTLSDPPRPSGSPSAAAPWRRWIQPAGGAPSRLDAVRECFLGVALGLHHEPARVRTAAFRAELREWWAARESAWLARPEARRDATAREAPAAPPAAPAREDDRMTAAPTARLSPGRADAGQDDSRVVGGRSSAERPAGHEPVLAVAPPPRSLDARTSDAKRAPGHERVLTTALGGVLFLVNLMRWLDLPRCFEARCELASRVGAWGVLDLLGRALLDGADPDTGADPLWELLAWIGGREPGTWPGEGFRFDGVFVPPPEWRAEREDGDVSEATIGLPVSPDLARWLAHVVPHVERRLVRALGLPDRGRVVPAIFLRAGRVHATSTHVDLVMSLQTVSVPVRRAGLDCDPGWVPDFARVVRFHFE